MVKIKVCGLRSENDIEIVNEYKPEYAGFIVNYPKSFRSIGIDQLKHLTSKLDSSIACVGVFVNEDVNVVIDCLKQGILSMVQLHGNEDEDYILKVKEYGPVIKAFQIQTKEDIEKALESPADYILLDQGKGSGKTFDWDLIPTMKREFFLAGGITLENVEEAIQKIHPYAIDLSSSLETNQVKDKEKVKQMIQKGRSV